MSAPTMALYSRALDEIYSLRRAFAYEADIIIASMTLKAFPKTRVAVSEGQAERFRAIARGDRDALLRYWQVANSPSLRSTLRETGLDSLTRDGWETAARATMRPGPEGEPAPEAEYARAVNEVLSLRRAAAYEARVLDVVLGYLSFPKSRRPVTEEQVVRLCLSAAGRVHTAYAGQNRTWLDAALVAAGGSTLLTRSSYEAEATGSARQVEVAACP